MLAVRLAERVLVAVVLLEPLARQDASDRPLLELDAIRACAKNMTLTDGTSGETRKSTRFLHSTTIIARYLA